MSELTVQKLSKHFGGLAALSNVDMTVKSGERRAIIGPNGAGKSTLFNLISGELQPTGGRIYLNGQDVTTLAVHQRANMGLGYTFQRNNLFPGLTAFENVRLAVQHQQRITRNPVKPASHFDKVNQDTEAMITRIGLETQKDQVASALAYGQQRALEIALALATDPQTLLFDEPTAGMSPAETQEIAKLIQSLPRSLTMLIVEHDMDVVFNLADYVTVLHYGQIISQGTPDEVRADSMVREIYLGTAAVEIQGD